jgi:phosphomannomutase
MTDYRNKQLIVFDLDGTLTESKSNLKPDMARILAKLLAQKKVAIIGGGTYGQFKTQFVAELQCPPALLHNLFLFPTTSTAFYRYRGRWKKVYAKELSAPVRAKIKKTFQNVMREVGYIPPPKTYGKVIEDRRSQITFSALGQDIVTALGKKGLRLKEKWGRENAVIKKRIADLLQKRLPNLEVRRGGITSIDVTKKGIDKAYGVRQIKKTLNIPIRDMIFIGDALYPGGNDAAARKTGIECVAVSGPQDTMRVIEKILAAR